MNERKDRVKYSLQKGQSSKAPNVQQRKRIRYRNIDEDDYGEDLDRKNHAPYINLCIYGWGTINRGVRYRDWFDDNLGNTKLKIPFFLGKNDIKDLGKEGEIGIWLPQLFWIKKKLILISFLLELESGPPEVYSWV